MATADKVPFDPGFSKFSVNFAREAVDILDQISALKQPHQRKFQFQRLESYVLPKIKTSASVYLGCILWGCYLHYRYSNDNREISGNVIREMETRPDIAGEIDFITEVLQKINKSSEYYLKRPLKLDNDLIGVFEDYRAFAELNNSFWELTATDQIKIPEKFKKFADYSVEQLEELKTNIRGIIDSGKIEELTYENFI